MGGIMRQRIPLLSIALVGLLFLQGCTEDTASSTDGVSGATDYAPLVSSAVEVREAVLRDRVIGSGIIEGRQEAVVRTRVAGTVRSISFELGESFRRGDVLVTLDDTVFQLNVRQLERQYEAARADLESKQQLFERGGLSERELNQLKANLDGIEAQLTQAQDALESTRVTAPIDGRISQKSPNLVIGDQLPAGSQVAGIVDLETLRVTLSVGQSQIFQIREGNRSEVRIQVPGGIITAEGTVRAISAGSDRRTGSWNVLVDFPNPAPEFLRAGISAEVVIFREDAPVQLVVPGASLVFRDGKTGVFIVQDSRARLVEVEVLDEYGEFAAVAGREEGINLLEHSVLVSGLSRIRSGDAAISGPQRN